MVPVEKKQIYRQLSVVSVKLLLLSLFDVAALFGSLDHRKRYARAYDEYLMWRAKDYRRFYRLIYRLKTAGLIATYQEGKQRFIELTPEGKRKIVHYLFEDERVPLPKSWDGKWRVVVFDIPENQRPVRDAVRQLLNRVGFYQLQRSVYIYPHDCIGIIRYLEEIYDINEYVQFIVAERVETEEDLITLFHDRGIIKRIAKHLVKNKSGNTVSTYTNDRWNRSISW